MPRKKRIWYPGASYHIMSRGNRKQNIFHDDEDRYIYLTKLLQAKERFDFSVYSYCLMTNHVHIQLQTNETEISTIMHYINMAYTVYFNRKYELVGHLFQGRYRSELIENAMYNLEVSRYIHLNPVKAEMVTLPIEYPWSSYRNYLEGEDGELISTNTILQFFQHNPSLYQMYVEYDLLET